MRQGHEADPALERNIEKLAAELTLTDSDDLPALAEIHEQFQNLAESLADTNPPLASAGMLAAALVEAIVCRKVDDAGATLQVLIRGIEGFQAVVRDRRDFSEVHWPPELLPTAVETVPGGKTEESGEGEASSKSGPKQSADAEPAAETETALIMDFNEADTSLLAEFIGEAREHCTSAEEMMLDLESGNDAEGAINAIFRSFHTIKGAAGFLALQPISVLAHELETALDLARKGDLTVEGRIADQIFTGIDTLRKLLDMAEEGMASGSQIDGYETVAEQLQNLRELLADPVAFAAQECSSRIGDILVDSGQISQAEINEALSHKADEADRLGETLVKQGRVPARSVAQALRNQKRMREDATKPAAPVVRKEVKIDTERLDRLVDTIGELVIVESMVGQDEEFLAVAPARISKNVSHLNKITRELQEMGMAMRLVPVRPTFQKLVRAVRDLNRKAGKQAELIISGEDTEVDRSIVENIADPLMHMIRNAVDHAIEPAAERKAAGKSPDGKIWLRAYHQGGNIYFEIEDDGKGLDAERILAKARERGLIEGQRELTEQEMYNLILQPGFSTAKQITDISGRGVGMDVVKKNIDTMRGELSLISTPGAGTKFTIKLPLTLAIIDGMLVRVREERYIIPTIAVLESIHTSPDQFLTIGGKRQMIDLRGKLVPLISIAKLFGLRCTTPGNCDSIVVVVENGADLVGLVVDELLGQRQTVIKSLGRAFAEQRWFSGGAILSNGNVGLILDVRGIVDLAARLGAQESESANRRRAEEAADTQEMETVTEPVTEPSEPVAV